MPSPSRRPGASAVPPNVALQRAAAGRATIDQARGILILLYRIDPDQALHVLRAWARETGSTVLTVARILVYVVCLDDTTSAWDRGVRDHVHAAVAEALGGQLPPPPSSRPRFRTVS